MVLSAINIGTQWVRISKRRGRKVGGSLAAPKVRFRECKDEDPDSETKSSLQSRP
jgi:hypothetical protein